MVKEIMLAISEKRIFTFMGNVQPIFRDISFQYGCRIPHDWYPAGFIALSCQDQYGIATRDKVTTDVPLQTGAFSSAVSPALADNGTMPAAILPGHI